MNLNYFKVTDHPRCEFLHGGFIYGSHKFLYVTRGLYAPFGFIAVCDLDKKTNRFLLKCEDNGGCAFFYSLSENEKYLAYVGGKNRIFPYGATSLRLKNLETGEEKVLAKCSGGQYITDPIFIDDSKILYSVNSSNGCTCFITDFEGNIESVSKEELDKFNPVCAVEDRLKKKLKKNLHVELILKDCSKAVFTVFGESGKDELRISSLDGSAPKTLKTGNIGVTLKGVNTCKFTYVSPSTDEWYLIDPETFRMTNLSKLYGVDEINTAIILNQ